MKQEFICLIIYVIVILCISFYISKKSSSNDFLIANRDRGFWSILFSKYAGSMGAGWFITYTAFAYEFGFGMFGMLIGFVLGYVLFAYLGSTKLYDLAHKNNLYTINQLVFYKTKSNLAKIITSIYSNLVQFLWLIISLVGGAKLFEHFNFFTYTQSLFILLIIVGIYLILSGFKGVIITDIIQSFIILGLLIVISYGIFSNVNSFNFMMVETKPLSIVNTVGLFLYGLLSFFAYADRYQLLFSAKSKKDFMNGMSFAVVPLLITATMLIVIGLYVFSLNPNLDPAIVFLYSLENYLSSSILSLGVIFFLAGIMSSIDTYVFTIATHSMFSFDKKNNPVFKLKIRMIITLFLALVVAYFSRDIIDLTVFGAAFSMSFAVPMLYLFFGKGKKFLNLVYGGFIGFVLGIIFLGINPIIMFTALIGNGVGALIRVKK